MGRHPAEGNTVVFCPGLQPVHPVSHIPYTDRAPHFFTKTAFGFVGNSQQIFYNHNISLFSDVAGDLIYALTQSA